MAEYIERDVALELMSQGYGIIDVSFCADIESVAETVYCAMVERLNATPAADVAPVVHGMWIDLEKDWGEKTVKCSRCNYPVSYFWGRTKYCPNCGARMDLDG